MTEKTIDRLSNTILILGGYFMIGISLGWRLAGGLAGFHLLAAGTSFFSFFNRKNS